MKELKGALVIQQSTKFAIKIKVAENESFKVAHTLTIHKIPWGCQRN